MQLIGMLDSPYVRRVAISLQLLELPFEHRSVSVFRGFDEFRRINPVVKAPTLVCDDGTVLMDSTLILDHIESTVEPSRRLMPTTVGRRREALRLIGLALAVTEKCVQMVYEHHQRPKSKMHEPWLERIRLQAGAGLEALEKSINAAPGPWLQGERLCASDLAVACLWRFSQFYLAETNVEAARYPALVGFSARAEALPEFASTPLD
jgi:glutathione S-transferase